MQIIGAALGTVIARVVEFAIIAGYFFFKRKSYPLPSAGSVLLGGRSDFHLFPVTAYRLFSPTSCWERATVWFPLSSGISAPRLSRPTRS